MEIGEHIDRLIRVDRMDTVSSKTIGGGMGPPGNHGMVTVSGAVNETQSAQGGLGTDNGNYNDRPMGIGMGPQSDHGWMTANGTYNADTGGILT